MYPWLWFWAPRIQFPYSGTLSQWVEPNTNWFFGAIQPQAGVGELEKKIFDVASYGRQLGLITEVLLSLTSSDTIDARKATESLARLKRIYLEIEDVKDANESQIVEAAIALLNKLRAQDSKQLTKVLEHFQSSDT